MKDSGRTRPFRELDHTADLKIEIRGRDEQDLFANAIESLYVCMGIPAGSIRGQEGPGADLEVTGGNREEVLVELLGEILYRATVERKRLDLHELFAGSGGDRTGGYRVVVRGLWHSLTREEMSGLREIKAVTYHDAQIRPAREGLVARVVMDL